MDCLDKQLIELMNLTFECYILLLKDETVLDLESRKISLKDLEHLLQVLKTNTHIGHVIFPAEVKKTANFQTILFEINKQITLNNRNFDTFTDDLTLCLLTKLTYDYKNNKENEPTLTEAIHPKDLEYFEKQSDWNSLEEKGWEVKQVFNILDDRIDCELIREHACIVYMNKKNVK